MSILSFSSPRPCQRAALFVMLVLSANSDSLFAQGHAVTLIDGTTLHAEWKIHSSSAGLSRTNPSGDTFTVSPLTQAQEIECGDDCAFFASDPNVTSIVFDGTLQVVGDNVFDGAAGGSFHTRGIFLEDALPGIDRVQVEVVNRRSNGQAAGWVAAGVQSPNGDTLTTWRFDVGAFEAAADPINTDSTFAVSTTVVDAFDSFGNLLGSFAFENDITFGEIIGGAFLLTRTINNVPTDIAGFDMARIVITWELEEAIMVDNFESGTTNRWSSTTP